MRRVLVLGALIGTLATAALAQYADSDGDGLPNAIETQLGTDPQTAEPLQLLYDDGVIGEDDGSVSGGHELAPDVTKVWAAHAGGDRFVWKIEFAEDYPDSGTVFHLYTRLDGDMDTGRQDSPSFRGVDMMYSFVDAENDPRVNNPAVRVDPWMSPRGIVEGNCIYVADDVRIMRQEDDAVFEWFVLSHQKEPSSDADTTGEFRTARLSIDADREPITPQWGGRENFEALPFSQELRYRLWHADGTVLLPASAAQTTGMILHHNRELQSDPEAEESVATWTLDAEGDYYVVARLSRYRGGQGSVVARLGGDRVGAFVSPSGRQKTFWYTEEPVAVSRGDELSLQSTTASGNTRFGDVMLVRQRPALPQLRVEDVEVFHMPDEPGERSGRVKVCWTTNRRAECIIDYELAGPEARVEEGTLEEGRGAVTNHYLVLPESMNASRYALTITATETGSSLQEPQTATAETVVEMQPPATQEGERTVIELTVQEPMRARRTWPVRSGVPLQQGVLWDLSACRLREGPAQFEALSRWPDGSVKWLIVDFIAETRPRRPQTYHLVLNERPQASESPLTVSRDDGVLTVETGAAVWRLPDERFAPFADVRVGGERITEDTEGFRIVDSDGTVFTTANAPPEEVVVEADGPVRATIRTTGDFVSEDGRRWMSYLCRLHFYAGLPQAQVEFTVQNSELESTMNLIRSASCTIGFPTAQARLAGDVTAPDGAAGLRLLQDYDNRYLVDGEPVGERAQGTAVLDGPDGRRLTACVRDFWRLYPKALQADADGLTIEMLPELPADQYQNPEDQELLTRLYYWCDDGQYKVKTGVWLTTDFMVDFGGAKSAPVDAFEHPLIAAASPEHYATSGVFGAISPQQKGQFPAYASSVDAAFGGFMGNREQTREYGFLNYGDWFGERTWNWGNQEYDTHNALAINFARTGSLDMLWAGEDAARHSVDVDTIHHWPDGSREGLVWTHCLGHTGGYFEPGWKDMSAGFAHGVTSHGHMWAQGYLAYAGLMGQRRYWDSGRTAATHITNGRANAMDFGSERGGGWPLIAAVGAYSHTSDPVYLNAARLIARTAVYKQQPDTGQWAHFIWECDHEPRHWGTKTFMAGVLMHGLMRYDLIEPTEPVKHSLRLAADHIWKDCYIPEDKGFIYAQCSSFWDRGSTWTMSLCGSSLAYACLLYPQQEHLDLVKEAFAHHVYNSGVSSFGKSFTQGTCFTPSTLTMLARLGVRDLPDPGPVHEQSRAAMREYLALTPGGKGEMAPIVWNASLEPVRCELDFLEPTEDWFDLPERGAEWTAEPGISRGPAVAVGVPGGAEGGDTASVPYRLRVGDEVSSGDLTVEVVARGAGGERVGWLTAEEDPMRRAAEQLGVPVTPIEDLAAADLSEFNVIVLGSEAWSKNFGNVQDAPRALQRFVAGGGNLLVAQLQDVGWRPDLLPLDIAVSDRTGQVAGLTKAGRRHAIAGAEQSVSSDDIAGVISHDTIPLASDRWSVLAACEDGSPAVLEARHGPGRVLVVQPSFDRPIYDPEDRSAEKSEGCTRLLQNVFSYIFADRRAP